jgi:hypothetical protein
MISNVKFDHNPEHDSFPYNSLPFAVISIPMNSRAMPLRCIWDIEMKLRVQTSALNVS